jgi:mRNA interferase MazF
LVLSPAVYNARVGLALVCRVATRIKGYPFEVVLKVSGRTVGAVLADQVEAVDWRARRLERIDSAPPAVVREVARRLGALTG